MCILLAFNDNQSLTYAAIMALCGVEDDKDLQPHILGLCSKLKILVREGPGKYVGAGDTFWVNEDFKSKFKRIKVPLVMIKEPGLASAATANGEPNPSSGDLPPAVEEERRHITEAAIVRIMKTRKSLTHNDLIGEVTRQVSNRFSPQPMVRADRLFVAYISFLSPAADCHGFSRFSPYLLLPYLTHSYSFSLTTPVHQETHRISH